MLTKGYAEDIGFSDAFSHIHCIPCIIGKHLQHAYDHLGNQATSPCELLYLDICGPFLTLSPQKTNFFIVILDDFSNWCTTGLLSKKSQAYDHYVATEARLELNTGLHVQKVCCDGTLELSKGCLAVHLTS